MWSSGGAGNLHNPWLEAQMGIPDLKWPQNQNMREPEFWAVILRAFHWMVVSPPFLLLLHATSCQHSDLYFWYIFTKVAVIFSLCLHCIIPSGNWLISLAVRYFTSRGHLQVRFAPYLETNECWSAHQLHISCTLSMQSGWTFKMRGFFNFYWALN